VRTILLIFLFIGISTAQWPGWGNGFGGFISAEEEPTIFEFNVISTETISGEVSTATDSILIKWGDGNSDKYSGTSQDYDHTYSPYSGATFRVKVYGINGSTLTKFRMDEARAEISFVLSDLPASVAYLALTGDNTVYGTLDGLPAAVTFIILYGNNTVSGDLADLPAQVSYFNCLGKNTISDYTSGHTWRADITYFRHVPASGGLDETEVDNILVDMASDLTGSGEINFTGTNAAPSATGEAAIVTLRAEGYTLTVTGGY